MMLDVSKIIQAVKNFVDSYDVEEDSYSLKERSDATWQEIGLETGISSKICQEQWTNLRNKYIQFLRDQEDSEAIENSVPFQYSKEMEFLRPFVCLKPTDPVTLENLEGESIAASDIDLEGMEKELDGESGEENETDEEEVESGAESENEDMNEEELNSEAVNGMSENDGNSRNNEGDSERSASTAPVQDKAPTPKKKKLTKKNSAAQEKVTSDDASSKAPSPTPTPKRGRRPGKKAKDDDEDFVAAAEPEPVNKAKRPGRRAKAKPVVEESEEDEDEDDAPLQAKRSRTAIKQEPADDKPAKPKASPKPKESKKPKAEETAEASASSAAASSQAPTENKGKDPIDLFFLSLSRMIKGMPTQKQAKLKMHCSKIIFEAEMDAM